MKGDEMLYAVGKMFARNPRQEVDPAAVCRKFDAYVRDLAAGRTPNDLTVEEVWQLGESSLDESEELPPDVARALGLEPESTYGEAVSAAIEECTMQDRPTKSYLLNL